MDIGGPCYCCKGRGHWPGEAFGSRLYCEICNGSGIEGVEPIFDDIEADMAAEAAAREFADNAMSQSPHWRWSLNEY